MISVKNNQRKINVNIKKLKEDAQHILGILNYADYDLGIWLTTNRTIRHYNKEYRKKDKATDVLSFGYHQLQPGERIQPETEDDKNLGDLIISLEYVKKDAPKWGHSFEQRMQVLLVHGICHLLGYDHETEEEYAVMNKLEQSLLQKLN